MYVICSQSVNDICPKCGGELVKYIFCFSCNFSDEDDESSTDWDDGYSDSSDLYSMMMNITIQWLIMGWKYV